jgi:hypothetical protein
MSDSTHNADEFSETYWNEQGVGLLLSCASGTCLVEVTLPDDDRTTAGVEVLLQPRDERGLPDSSPIRLGSEQVVFVRRPDGRRQGRFWLPPGVSPRLARDCHFRLLAPKMKSGGSISVGRTG